MFTITTIPPAIEELNADLVLLIDRLAKEPPLPRSETTTREIDMTPESMSLGGVWSAGILPAVSAPREYQ